MNLYCRAIIVVLFSCLVFGCSGKGGAPVSKSYSKTASALPVKVSKSAEQVQTMLLKEFKAWEGTPHKMGGNSKRGVDCSGFVHYMYGKLLHLDVPRSTKLLLKSGNKISKKKLKPGDLVIFRPHSYPRHVGIYVGDNKFIHASTSKGVVKSDLDNSYWKKHYRMSRRIIITKK